MGRVTRIRVIEFSLIPIDLPLLLSLSLYSFIVHRRKSIVFHTTNSKRFESLDTGERNLENRLALTSGVGLARGGEKSRSGDRKPGKVRQGTPLWHRHPRWLSKLRVRLNFTCQIFFSKFRNSPSPLYPPLFPFPFFLFFFPSLSKHRKYFSTLVSLYVGRKIREIPTRHTERERERNNVLNVEIYLSTTFGTEFGMIFPRNLFLCFSLSLSQTDFIKASGGSFKKNSWRKTK